ncbi:MAG: class I SAM-dependent methyltransferase [Planctomycetes bacterium]|nr:class I SAM-dependent methyltransferase [Planctomycetota bacterium]
MKKKGHRRGSPAAPLTDWGDVAKWYDQLVGEGGSEYHQHVVIPGVVRLLAPRGGMTVLDVACGQGVLCRILHRGGVKVTGVDSAAELLRLARMRSDASIEFIKADARDLAPLGERVFDSAACVLAVQNINPIRPVFAAVSRHLVEGGSLVIVMMHPCFRAPKTTSWGYDEQQRVQFRRVDKYLLPRKEPIVTHPGSAPDQYTWTFHRPIESYVKALRNEGLLIDAIEEWPSHKTSEAGPRAAAENTARKETPMFMALRARKISAAVVPAKREQETSHGRGVQGHQQDQV